MISESDEDLFADADDASAGSGNDSSSAAAGWVNDFNVAESDDDDTFAGLFHHTGLPDLTLRVRDGPSGMDDCCIKLAGESVRTVELQLDLDSFSSNFYDEGWVDRAWTRLCNVFGSVESLQRLRVYFCEDTGSEDDYWDVKKDVIVRLSELIRQVPTLKSLVIEGMSKEFGYESDDGIQFLLCEPNFFLTKHNIPSLSDGLASHPSLESFSLLYYNCDEFEGADVHFIPLFAALATVPNLRQLDLRPDMDPSFGGTSPSVEAYERLFVPTSLKKVLGIATLEVLRIDGIFFGRKQCAVLRQMIAASRSMRSLKLRGCLFADPNWIRGIAENQGLRRLFLPRGRLGRSHLLALGDAVRRNQTMQHLSLSKSFVESPDLVDSLFRSFGESSRLKTLDLGEIHGVFNRFPNLQPLRQSKIECLLLDDFLPNRPDVSAFKASQILHVVDGNSYLKTLELYEYRCFDKDFFLDLARTMGQPDNAMEDLKVSFDCLVSEDVVNCICLFLEETRLKRLFVDVYSWRKDSERQVRDPEPLLLAMQKNFYMESLNVYSVLSMNEEVQFTCDAVTELNKAGRRYLLTDASSRAKGVAVLAGVASNLNYLYFHLLESPSLCDLRESLEIA